MRKIIFIFFIIFLFFSCINCSSDEVFLYDDLLYKDIKGKIYIPNTNINHYILQATDNSYYLNHSYTGDSDKYGSIFLDFRNDILDKKLLIYGHNSKYDDKALFKDLENYKEQSFYKNNQYIYVTFGSVKYKYLIFSINIVSKDDHSHTRLKYSHMDFYRYLLDTKSYSLYDTYVDVGEDDFVITLQTCNYTPYDNTYLLINAKRVDRL